MMIELRLAREDSLASLTLEMVVAEVLFEYVLVRRIESAPRLQAMSMLCGHSPVFIAFGLSFELPMARVAPNMVRAHEEVGIELPLCPKPEKT